jgi:hypothetical protein
MSSSTFSKKMTNPWDYGIQVVCRTHGTNNALAACHLYDDDGDWLFLIDMEYDVNATATATATNNINNNINMSTVRFKQVFGENWHSFSDQHDWSLADLNADAHKGVYNAVVESIKMLKPQQPQHSVDPVPVLSFSTAANFIKAQESSNSMAVMWETYRSALYVN